MHSFIVIQIYIYIHIDIEICILRVTVVFFISQLNDRMMVPHLVV